MLNWLTRYAPAVAALESHGPLGSLLDVGSGPHGIACVRPEQPFVGVDIEFPSEPVETMVGLEITPGPLPFADGAFDTVLCLDSLEHIPRPDRASFVAELARVAAGRLLIACPTDAAQASDDYLRAMWHDRILPSWLEEHGRYVLPSAAEIEGFVRSVPGFDAVEVPMGNAHLQTMLVLGDLMPGVNASAQHEMREHAAEWAELLTRANFGTSLRAGWLLVRQEATTALVSTDDLEGSTLAALQSPGAVLKSGPRAGAVLARAAEPAPAVAAAGEVDDGSLLLWLTPDWTQADSWVTPLAEYIGSAPVDGSVCLCIDASHAATEAEAILRAVGHACEQLAGDEDYGDVVLLTDAGDRHLAVQVSTAGDVRAALVAVAR